MSKSACTHGMPSRASCVECMFEHGLGAPQVRVNHGVYARCVDLVRDGVTDVDVPVKIQSTLHEDERDELVLVALRVYAAQARRQVEAEVRRATVHKPGNPGRDSQTRFLKERWARAKAAGCKDLTAYNRFLSDSWRAQEVALGNGRRLTRGEMTAADLDLKIEQLTKQQDGIERTIEEYTEHRDFLQATGARTLNDAVEKAA